MKKKLTFISLILFNLFAFSQNENNKCVTIENMKVISQEEKIELIEEVKRIINPKKTEKGIINTLVCPPMTLTFDYGCDFPYNYENIKFTLGVLLVDKKAKLILELNSDIKTYEKNPDINLKRGKSVQKVFEYYGIQTNRIKIIDFGIERPISSNKTEQGRKENNYIYLNIKR